MRRLFILIIFLVLLPGAHCQTVYDSGITMSIETVYEFSSPTTSQVYIIYRFENPLQVSTNLEYQSQFTYRKPFANILEITDSPTGSVFSTISDDRKEILFGFSRIFSPGEIYEIRIKIIDNRVTEKAEDTYRFKDIQGNFFSWPIEELKVSVIFPKTLYRSYNAVKVDPGAKFEVSNQKKMIIWEKDGLAQGEQFTAVVEYDLIPNYHALAFIGLLLIIILFIAYFYFVKGRHSFFLPRGFVNTMPGTENKGKTNIVTKIEEILKDAKEEVLITSPWIYYVDWFTSNIKQLTDKGIKVRIVTWPGFQRKKIGARWEIVDIRRQSFALERFLNMFPKDTVKLNENIHSKLFIVDRKLVMASSANITQTGFWENFEAGMWLEDKDMAKSAVEYFDTLWNSEKSVSLTRELVKKGGS